MASESFFAGAVHGRRRMSAAPSGARPGRALAVLTVLTAALSVAFVYAPRFMASAVGDSFHDQRSLIRALRGAFAGYWNSGSGDFAPSMQRIVDYWVRYHVAKAVIAALLLAVLAVATVRLGRMYAGTGLGVRRRLALASAWVVAATLAFCSAILVAVNVQGALAPFSSLLSMLPAGRPDRRLAGSLDQIRQGLAHYPASAGHNSPALRRMVNDFAFYHATMVAIAGLVAVALIGMSALAWRRFAKSAGDRWARGSFALLGVALLGASLVLSVIAAANLGTANDPAPALAAFFGGGR